MTQADALRAKATELLKKAQAEESKAFIAAGKLALAYHQGKLPEEQLKQKLISIFGIGETK